MHDDERMILDGLVAGADGYLLKTDADAHLAEAVAALVAGRTFFSPAIAEPLRTLTTCRASGGA
jgi:DNA-binding NarL/FixJ family response regulator